MLIKSFIWFRLISVSLLLSWGVANQIRPNRGPSQADGTERGWLWSPAASCLQEDGSRLCSRPPSSVCRRTRRTKAESAPIRLPTVSFSWETQTNPPAGVGSSASTEIIMKLIKRKKTSLSLLLFAFLFTSGSPPFLRLPSCFFSLFFWLRFSDPFSLAGPHHLWIHNNPCCYFVNQHSWNVSLRSSPVPFICLSLCFSGVWVSIDLINIFLFICFLPLTFPSLQTWAFILFLFFIFFARIN